MPLFMYQAAYTPESLAVQMKNPEDRVTAVGNAVTQAVGGKLLAAAYMFGEYDVMIVYDAPDDASAAAISVAIAAGGAVRSSKTTRLLTGAEWIDAMRKTGAVTNVYRPAR